MEIACYVRVSTEEQSLERQLEATHEYADQQFNTVPVETYRDKSTGTDTDRSSFRQLLEDVQAGQYDAVVANSVSRISRSIRDLDQTVETIVDESDTTLLGRESRTNERDRNEKRSERFSAESRCLFVSSAKMNSLQ